MFNNLLLLTDSYKVSHHAQYPKGTTQVYSFFESRGGEFDPIVFFGLQYLLDKLAGCRVTAEHITEAREMFAQHFGSSALFNEDGWQRIIAEHGGRLPLKIRAVPEGSLVSPRQTLITIENTDPALPWLTNYLETLLVQVWYPTTVATQSWHMKRRILDALEKSGDPTLVPFKLHDFGFRGSTSVESAGIGGCAHLVNFMGTDTMAALELARECYGEPMAGFSIPAAEHSTITSWGREHEVDAFRNMLDAYPSGLVAVVSDSYDIYRACEQLWGRDLKDRVLARDGVLIVRPDSGDPPSVVVRVLNILGECFGWRENAKGYRVLNDKVRVIQGDGIDRAMLGTILDGMLQERWSADNVAFGSGGGLLQQVNRDTCRFAFKCSSVTVDGQERDVMKSPTTDPTKRSRAGRFDVGDVVFLNGRIMRHHTLAEIRALADVREAVA